MPRPDRSPLGVSLTMSDDHPCRFYKRVPPPGIPSREWRNTSRCFMIWTPGGYQVVPPMWPNAEFNYSYSDRDSSYFMRCGGGGGRGEVMHPWGILGGVTRYILGWGGAARPLTWPRHWMNSFSPHLKCTFQDRKLSTFPTNGKTVRWLHDNR